MKWIFTIILIFNLLLPFPVYAQDLDLDLKPVEEDILKQEQMEEDLRLQRDEMEKQQELMAEKKNGAGKWLYILGGLAILGAAGGGSGGDGSSSGSDTGSVTGTW